MRDNKDRSLIGKQETLKPAGAGDIQVVCWLIKYDEIRPFEQQLSQCNAGLLPAGERGYLLICLFTAESEPCEHAVDLAPVSVAAQVAETILEQIVFFHERIKFLSPCRSHLLFIIGKLLLHCNERCLHGEKFRADGIFGGHILLLGQIADREIP